MISQKQVTSAQAMRPKLKPTTECQNIPFWALCKNTHVGISLLLIGQMG